MVRKILRLENQSAVGMVYPIACPYEDLLFSGFGVKLQDAPIFPRYISVLVRAEDEEPTIKKSGTGDDEVFMMQHTKVIAVAAKNPKPFSVEAFCQLEAQFQHCRSQSASVGGKGFRRRSRCQHDCGR